MESEKTEKFGTVGCAVLDKYGNLAAGTSTGGLFNKDRGRIGDTAVINISTYANNQIGGLSLTGKGEYILKHAIAYDIIARMKYKLICLYFWYSQNSDN